MAVILLPSGPLPHLPTGQETLDCWLHLAQSARHRLLLGWFYAADHENRLAPLFEAWVRAAERGVEVKLRLCGRADLGPETRAVLESLPGIKVERLLFPGVHHAKYMVVDERLGWLGSHNLDWRALDHNVELGLYCEDAAVCQDLARVFDHDGGTHPGPRLAPTPGLRLAASQPHPLPAGIPFDRACLLAAIKSAQSRICLSALNLRVTPYDDRATRGEQFCRALGRAAERGVTVEVLVSHWACSPYGWPTLASLMARGCQVRTLPVADAPEGPIPYARVHHAKLLTVDDRVAWVGTSNYGPDDFERSRNLNLGLMGAVVGEVQAFFSGLFERGLEAQAPDELPQERGGTDVVGVDGDKAIE